MSNDIVKEINQTNNTEEKPKKDFRDSIYGRMDVSVKTMDRVIISLFVLIILSLLFGVVI